MRSEVPPKNTPKNCEIFAPLSAPPPPQSKQYLALENLFVNLLSYYIDRLSIYAFIDYSYSILYLFCYLFLYIFSCFVWLSVRSFLIFSRRPPLKVSKLSRLSAVPLLFFSFFDSLFSLLFLFLPQLLKII